MKEPARPPSVASHPAFIIAATTVVVLSLVGIVWLVSSHLGQHQTAAVQAAPTPAPTSVTPPATAPAASAAITATAPVVPQSFNEPSVPVPNAVPKVVDIFKTIDPLGAGVVGQWAMKDGAFISDNGDATRFDFNYRPPVEYDFRFVFARLSGDDGIEPVIVAGGRQFTWTMAGWHNTVCGLQEMMGAYADNNSTTAHGDCFVNRKKYTCLVKVRHDGIQLFIDNRPIGKWQTDFADLANANRKLNRMDTLGLSTWQSSFAIYSAEVTEISGTGKIMTADDPSDAKAVALIKYVVGDGRIVTMAVLFSNGHLMSADSDHIWFRSGDKLAFRWGDSLDQCTLSGDRKTLTGATPSGEAITGTVLMGGI